MFRYIIIVAAIFAAQTAQAKECQAWTTDDAGRVKTIPVFMAWMATECSGMPGLYATVWNRTYECIFPQFDGIAQPKVREYPDPVTGRSVYQATKSDDGLLGCLAPGAKYTVVLSELSGWYSGIGYKTPATQLTTTPIGPRDFRLYNVRVTDDDGTKRIIDSRQTTVCDPLYYDQNNMTVGGVLLIEFQYATGCHKI